MDCGSTRVSANLHNLVRAGQTLHCVSTRMVPLNWFVAFVQRVDLGNKDCTIWVVCCQRVSFGALNKIP